MHIGAHRMLGYTSIQRDSGYLTSVKTKQMPGIILKGNTIKVF